MAEPATISCRRCGRSAPAATGVTYQGALGEAIADGTCGDCWQEWLRAEVMVINELRLDFMDPEAPAALERHLRDFLALDD